MRGTMVQQTFVLYWGHSHLATVLLLALLILYFTLASRLPAPRSSLARLASSRWAVLDMALIGVAIAHCALYLNAPNFADFVEPMIPLLASNYLHGAPVYADWTVGHAIVGSIYGPYVFLAQLPALLWYPTIGATKLPGICSGLGSIVLLFLAVRTRVRSFNDALALCALMVGLLAFELHYWFWNRPDSFLIAVVSLGVLLYDRAHPSVCLAGLGLLAGVAINLKLYAPIYLLPLAIACLPAIGSWSRLLASAAIGGVLFLGTVALPFGLGFASLHVYIVNLSMMPNQGFDLAASVESMFYGLSILALPLLTLWARWVIAGGTQTLAITVFIFTGLMGVVAGNPGGGPPYMMPLIPLALYLAVRLQGQDIIVLQKEIAARRLVLLAVAICAAPVWAYSWFQIGSQFPHYRTELAKIAELRALFAAFPGSEVGHNAGRTDIEQDEFYRVEKAFLGQVTRFDWINFADQRAAGLPASIVYPLFENCSVPSWILPRWGGRFRGTTWDGRSLLLDGGASELFRANYEQSGEYSYYELWRCKDRPDAAMTPDPSMR
jgi:hypothetical protein